MRLSKGHQEMQISYFGSLCDSDYAMECFTHLQLYIIMVMIVW